MGADACCRSRRRGSRLDVLLNPGFTAPLACACPQVTVFHDLQHKRHPEYFRWLDLPFWRFFLYWSAHVSRLVVAVSQATAADLRRFYRLPDAKIRVVPSGVDPAFFEVARRRRPERVAAGGLDAASAQESRRAAARLRALPAGAARSSGWWCAGCTGSSPARCTSCGSSLGLADAVEFPGWIPREELYDLFARAWAFFYPSKFEGFGLPVLEALAAGVPTACSAIEPLASIAGDAALQFDPSDPEAIAAAMRRVVDDEDAAVRGWPAAGPRRAARVRVAADGGSDGAGVRGSEMMAAPPDRGGARVRRRSRPVRRSAMRESRPSSAIAA